MKRSSVDVVLDATYESVLAVGVKRTTFADVARRAGMSRATLYTHFDDVDAAVAALMTREFGQVLVLARGRAGQQPDARARLIATVEEVLDRVPRHPLFAKVLDVDPDLLLPYLLQRLGRVQRRARAVVEELVRAGQEDGSIRSGDPAVLSHLVTTTVQSVLTSTRIAEAELGSGAVHDGLLGLLDRGLAP